MVGGLPVTLVDTNGYPISIADAGVADTDYVDAEIAGLAADVAADIAALSSSANPSTIGVGGGTPSGAITADIVGDVRITGADDGVLFLRRATTGDTSKVILGESTTERVRISLDSTGALVISISTDGIAFTEVLNVAAATGRINSMKLVSQAVASLGTATAGAIKYASDGRKNGEGAGLGTGVLVFGDGTAWRACDTGASVAA